MSTNSEPRKIIETRTRQIKAVIELQNELLHRGHDINDIIMEIFLETQRDIISAIDSAEFEMNRYVHGLDAILINIYNTEQLREFIGDHDADELTMNLQNSFARKVDNLIKKYKSL